MNGFHATIEIIVPWCIKSIPIVPCLVSPPWSSRGLTDNALHRWHDGQANEHQNKIAGGGGGIVAAKVPIVLYVRTIDETKVFPPRIMRRYYTTLYHNFNVMHLRLIGWLKEKIIDSGEISVMMMKKMMLMVSMETNSLLVTPINPHTKRRLDQKLQYHLSFAATGLDCTTGRFCVCFLVGCDLVHHGNPIPTIIVNINVNHHPLLRQIAMHHQRNTWWCYVVATSIVIHLIF